MFGSKKKKERGVIVLKQTREGECGGTDATLDKNAPKQIVSEDMILFDVTSALGDGIGERPGRGANELGYVSAFAAPVRGGTFLFLETGEHFQRRAGKDRAWAQVRADVFPALVRLVRQYDLAASNGRHSQTHGLPENFGGSVRIEYGSGETISYSDNQTPVLRREAGEEIAALFRGAMAGERVALPDLCSLTEIRFAEERENGGFTRAVLTIAPDGTATNRKRSRYDGAEVYESENKVDAATVDAIKRNVEETGLLAWSTLPASKFNFEREKSLVFVFSDGGEIAVPGNRLVPSQIQNGFFNVELELTTKN